VPCGKASRQLSQERRLKTILDIILEDVREEVAVAKLRHTAADLRGMIADTPPTRDFVGALARSFGLIAEIKECSPSVGAMRAENVRDAASVYSDSPIVRAVSILTNERHFGMGISRLAAMRSIMTLPLLRKDFLLDEYQIREARAFGADAILLMANVLDAPKLAGFYDLAQELGMQALFEVHTAEEIEMLPPTARVVGINSRKFQSDKGFVGASGRSEKDFSVDFSVFELAEKLPAGTIKVAESGIEPRTLDAVRENFHAALVGTALLRDPRGIAACLADFESAITGN